MAKANAREWADDNSRPRVLVESADAAIQTAVEHLLREDGFSVATCGGPDMLRRHRCPLVTVGHCPLVAGADLVVHALDPERAANARVLGAIKDRCSDTPVVVEVTASAVDRHRELLAGCVHVSHPMTHRRLLDGIATALRAASDRNI